MTKIDENIGRIKLCNKPFEKMALTELYAERACHNWHRVQICRCYELLKRRKWWLEENQPIYTKEEINAQYENGEITQKQYKTAFARRKKAIDHRMRVEDYMTYANLIANDEDSLVVYLDELIAKKIASTQMPDGKSHNKAYDPRKRESVNNQRKWSTRVDKGKMPKLKASRKRWRAYKSQDNATMHKAKTFPTVMRWDLAKLRTIGADRGYFTDMALTAIVAEALDVSSRSAKMLLNSGKFSWGQCIVLGAQFEMTPKEFCDTFMNGYFKEVADGVYKAHIDDPHELLKGDKEDNGKA